MKRPEFDEIFMELAHLIARRSTCARLQVGCVITDETRTRVLSIGYNGNYRGGYNVCDSIEPGNCGCLHAEDNACIKLDYRESTKVAYITHLPCKMCAKRLVNAGVQKVFYSKAYRSNDAKAILRDAAVKLIHYPYKGEEKC